jgi:hypothetical protein
LFSFFLFYFLRQLFNNIYFTIGCRLAWRQSKLHRRASYEAVKGVVEEMKREIKWDGHPPLGTTWKYVKDEGGEINFWQEGEPMGENEWIGEEDNKEGDKKEGDKKRARKEDEDKDPKKRRDIWLRTLLN